MQLPPIAATTVGSFPRPAWLATNERMEVSFVLADDALHEAQDDATLLAMYDQERAGLDLITDGEQRRTSFINHLLAGLNGVDMEHRQAKNIRRRAGNERLVPTIVGKIRRRGPIAVEDLRFAKAHSSRPVKIAVPGPLTIIDTSYDEAYGDEAALAVDLAVALNEELLDLQAAGADALQVDEPAMTRYHDKTAAFAAEALDRCLEGVTVPTFVHLCYGYPGAAGPSQHFYEYPELLALLMETRIGGFSLEFARSGYAPAILQGCGDRLIMYGCIDPGDAPPEPLDLVVSRVRAALEYVEPERLLIAPDCGLMMAGRDLARRKSELLATAAEEVRRTL